MRINFILRVHLYALESKTKSDIPCDLLDCFQYVCLYYIYVSAAQYASNKMFVALI